MKTVNTSQQLADEMSAVFSAGGTPWVILVDGEAVAVATSRAMARGINRDHKGTVAKAADFKFYVGIDEFFAPVAALAAQGSPEAKQAMQDARNMFQEVFAPEIDAEKAQHDAQAQGDAAANAALIEANNAATLAADPTQAAKGTKIPLTRESTIEKPCKRVWHIACEMADAAGGHKNIKRKDVLARCVAEGIAFYTARTQYQMWLTIQNGGTL